MRIAVSGSIADDYLLTFPGRFADMILPDQLDRLSLSFLADSMEHRRGGIGCNIAFGMGQLGAKPFLIGAAGQDFVHGYQQWMESHDVDCSGVYLSDKATARFLCTTDNAQSQIATFYGGAMADARLIDLHQLHAEHGPFDAIIVCPDDPEGMLRRTREAHELGIPVIADPSQQLARMEGPEIVPLIEGARWLLCNDYERGLILSKTGWSSDELRSKVDVLVTTHGADGASVEMTDSGEELRVSAVPPREDATLEPTGAGDAFRAGFLAGLAHDLPLARAAELASAVATLALETTGPQDYVIKAHELEERLAAAYGPDEAAAIVDVIG